jgi:hypothetical protein
MTVAWLYHLLDLAWQKKRQNFPNNGHVPNATISY